MVRPESNELGGGPPAPDSRVLWRSVDHLLDSAGEAGIMFNGLGALAAGRLRRLGRPVPESFEREERAANLFAAISTPLLKRIRASCDEPLIVFKGPEVASAYPPGGRSFSDLDLVTPQAASVQQSLLDAGFVVDELGAEATYHLQPLILLTLPLQVEVHGELKWPAGITPPTAAELLEASVPSTTGVDGIRAPRPSHHALLLAAHSWQHRPLRMLRDLLDIAALTVGGDERELTRTAKAWGLEQVWRTTSRSIDVIFYGRPRTVPLRTWARHLSHVRERTVLESHAEHWLAPFCGMPFHRALGNTASVLREEVRPLPDETWSGKLRRSATALRHASMELTPHAEDGRAGPSD